MERVICESILLKDISKEEFLQRIKEMQSSSDLTDLVANIDKNISSEDLQTILQAVARSLEKLKRPVHPFGMYKDGTFIGYVALVDCESSTPEIQIELVEEHRHRGIGYRALRHVIQEAFQNMNVDFLIYRVHYENVASIALVEKCEGVLICSDPLIDQIIRTYHICRPTL